MARTPQDVTDAELKILQILWAKGPLTIRSLADQLQPESPDKYYATVKKLLERLENKAFVRREPEGIAFIYEAVVDRDQLVGRRLRELADVLCDGSVTPLVTQLAHHEQLTVKQQKLLMQLIDELANEHPKSKRKKS